MASSDDAKVRDGMAAGGFLTRWSRRKVHARDDPTPAESAAAVAKPVQPPTAVPRVPPVPLVRSAAAPAGSAAAQGTAQANAQGLAQANAPAEARAEPSAVAGAAQPAATTAPALPTMSDVPGLDRHSDYTRFMASGVDPGVKNAALKKLFADPHFNVMDGLDTYIDDYNTPDPLPLSMLRKMAQSKFLGLFDDEVAQNADLNTDPMADEPADPQAAALRMPDARSDNAPDNTPDTIPEPLATSTAPTDEDASLRLQQDPATGPPGADQGPGPGAGGQH